MFKSRYMHARVRLIWTGVALPFLVAAVVTGCSQNSGQRGTGIVQQSSTSNFRVINTDAKQLVKVNSLRFAPLEFDRNAVSMAKKASQWQAKLSEIAREEVSIPVSDMSDFLLEIRVLAARERLGSRFGAEQGAMLSLHTEVRDRQENVVWAGDYFFADRAVTDNILTLPSLAKGKSTRGWAAVDDLYAQAVKATLSSFSHSRSSAYVRGGAS